VKASGDPGVDGFVDYNRVSHFSAPPLTDKSKIKLCLFLMHISGFREKQSYKGNGSGSKM